MYAQNLVPNPSFENLVSCPTMEGQIYLADPWFSPYLCLGGTYNSCSSSDLFNQCHVVVDPTNNVDVPLNMLGYQEARTGEGYAGLGFWSNNEWREKIETVLMDSLLKDHVYCVKMFVVNKLTDISPSSLTSTSNLHITFTTDTLIDYPNNFTYLEPSIKNIDSFIISDTSNWTEISGCYKAQGGENFITIGSFYSNANSTVGNVNSMFAYYFIDDVSVEEYNGLNCNCPEYDTLFQELPELNYTLSNVFTPNNDGVNDVWTINFIDSNEYVLIFNRWGVEIINLNKDNTDWKGDFFGKPANEGVYFYSAYLRGEFKTGFIQLKR